VRLYQNPVRGQERIGSELLGTHSHRAAGASMGVSGQVTTLKYDYRVGDGY
jgi:hypothetical protein